MSTLWSAIADTKKRNSRYDKLLMRPAKPNCQLKYCPFSLFIFFLVSASVTWTLTWMLKRIRTRESDLTKYIWTWQVAFGI
jgi:hypothetical protein